MERYFDNAATTPVDPRVREAMLPYLGDEFGNAHSIHGWGLRAREAVERARALVAEMIGAEDPSQIFFTSGATEANNWVLNAADQIVISPFEHSAMREPALRYSAQVFHNDGPVLVRPAPQDRREFLAAMREAARTAPENLKEGVYRRSIDALEVLIDEEDSGRYVPKTLVSVMAVNNEIGAVWDVRDYAKPGDLVHSDITQAAGKTPIDVSGLDFASFSAHKFYGPKGVGALYCRESPPPPLILGGDQEHGVRGGTLPVPAIVGMGKAAEVARFELDRDRQKAQELREILLQGLSGLSDWQINPALPDGQSFPTSPFILSVSFLGVEGETLVLELDRAGFAVSAGAACSSASTEPSHVLTALNLQPEWLRGTIRISFGRFNSKEATANLANKLRWSVDSLRTL